MATVVTNKCSKHFAIPHANFFGIVRSSSKMCAGKKKLFNLSSKAALSARIQEPRKNIFFRAKKIERCAKKSLDLKKKHEKPGDLGDLAKSTYNNLVTFDSRGT